MIHFCMINNSQQSSIDWWEIMAVKPCSCRPTPKRVCRACSDNRWTHNERFPDHRHRNLKAFRERIQNRVSYWFVTEYYLYDSSGLGVRVVRKLSNNMTWHVTTCRDMICYDTTCYGMRRRGALRYEHTRCTRMWRARLRFDTPWYNTLD